MIEEKRFQAGPVEISYAVGPPLLLLHGGGDRWQNFLPLMPTPAARWQLFALDLDNVLKRISCPTLLVQANPAQGGVAGDAGVAHALSLLTGGAHVRLENAGHDLGLALGRSLRCSERW